MTQHSSVCYNSKELVRGLLLLSAFNYSVIVMPPFLGSFEDLMRTSEEFHEKVAKEETRAHQV